MAEDKYEYLGRPQHGSVIGRTSGLPWDKAAFHRAQILRLLPNASRGRRGIVGVVGVGDGTALGLQSLLERFHEVHLIDRDQAAIQEVIREQNLTDRQRIFHHGRDLTGIDALLSRDQPMTDEEWEQGCQSIARHSLPDLGPFDLLISNSMIPELTIPIADSFAHDQAKMGEMIRTCRDSHIQQLLKLVIPGGCLIIVMDVVGSKSLPKIGESPGNLPELVQTALEAGNFFPGSHPGVMDQTLRALDNYLQRVDAAYPWIRETQNEHRVSMAFRGLVTPSDESVI
ncbi:MAG: hypothetical protein GY819_16330 [Planctomycetaceae bacterium]|nr:hypothetical protein [Planctomycetaceae bacterium]MCP4464361.1 hypothetical protein [Planctomycetaceae bacterium]MDG1809182.1 hypothetical protein [Pirellulaceae bacterium]MDG2103392.1 hypothetical protein [Pirellulaceae bacterium]